MNEDRQLWNNMRLGKRDAFEKIYQLHVDNLFRYGRKLATDPAQAEDCIQDLFIKIWNKRESLGETDSIKNYLFTSLRRMIYRAGNKKTISTDPHEMRNHDETEPNFEEFIIQGEQGQEQAEKIKIALSNISDRQREVIYLRFYQDMDYEEICEVMDISYQGARNMLFKAIKNLKNKLIIVILLLQVGYNQVVTVSTE